MTNWLKVLLYFKVCVKWLNLSKQEVCYENGSGQKKKIVFHHLIKISSSDKAHVTESKASKPETRGICDEIISLDLNL